MATLLTERPEAAYTCSQAELYAGLKMAWDSQEEKETEFLAENTKYTAGLAVTKRAAIAAAKALPDGQARTAEAESLHLDLEEKWAECIGKWNSLDGYIKKAFKGVHYKPRIEEAGKDYYETAAQKNWEDLSLMLQSGKNFITNHNAVLLADGGMPATFAAAYTTEQEEYDELWGEYMDARQDSQVQTDAKINANNAIYADGIEMMDDGKHIFRNNPSVRERFVWAKILELVSSQAGGGSVEAEGDLGIGQIFHIDFDYPGGSLTTPIALYAIGSTFRFYFSDTPGAEPGMLFVEVADGQVINTTVASLGAAISNGKLNVKCVGVTGGHWKVIVG